MQCTILQPKGTSRNAFLPETLEGVPNPSVIGTMLRRATPPELIGSWPYDASVIHLYAYKTGKAGTENKHELPPPHDSILLFGDAVLVATTNNVVSRFNGDDFKKFFTAAIGGEEDLDDTDGEDSEEEEEEEVEEEEEALTAFEFKGKTYYHDAEYKVYIPDEDGAVSDPVGIYDPATKRIRRLPST